MIQACVFTDELSFDFEEAIRICAELREQLDNRICVVARQQPIQLFRPDHGPGLALLEFRNHRFDLGQGIELGRLQQAFAQGGGQAHLLQSGFLRLELGGAGRAGPTWPTRMPCSGA